MILEEQRVSVVPTFIERAVTDEQKASALIAICFQKKPNVYGLEKKEDGFHFQIGECYHCLINVHGDRLRLRVYYKGNDIPSVDRTGTLTGFLAKERGLDEDDVIWITM